MLTVIELNKPENSKFGHQPLALNSDEQLIVDKLLSNQHAVNDLLQTKIIQASRKAGAFDLKTFETLTEEVKRVLERNRDPSRKLSRVNVVVELREAFQTIVGISIL